MKRFLDLVKVRVFQKAFVAHILVASACHRLEKAEAVLLATEGVPLRLGIAHYEIGEVEDVVRERNVTVFEYEICGVGLFLLVDCISC